MSCLFVTLLIAQEWRGLPAWHALLYQQRNDGRGSSYSLLSNNHPREPQSWGKKGFQMHPQRRIGRWSSRSLWRTACWEVCTRMCMRACAWVLSHSAISNSCNPMACTLQVLLSIAFFRQEYSSGLSFPSPGHLSHQGIKPGSPELQADSLLSEPQEKIRPQI